MAHASCLLRSYLWSTSVPLRGHRLPLGSLYSHCSMPSFDVLLARRLTAATRANQSGGRSRPFSPQATEGPRSSARVIASLLQLAAPVLDPGRMLGVARRVGHDVVDRQEPVAVSCDGVPAYGQSFAALAAERGYAHH